MWLPSCLPGCSPTRLFNRPRHFGTVFLALVGLFNIVGTYGAGWLGDRFSKPKLLMALYGSRGIAIIAFLLLPLSTYTVYAFGIIMGLLWLSTVPLTNGIVANMFGVKYLSMLSGIVFSPIKSGLSLVVGLAVLTMI